MQINIVDAKTKVKNVNAYNVGSLFIDLNDKVVSRKYRQ